MGALVFDRGPPPEKISTRVIEHEINKEGRYTYENGRSAELGMRCYGCLAPPSLEAPGDSDTQWTRQPDDSGATMISTETSGEDFRGDFSMVWRVDRQLDPGFVGYNTEDHRFSVHWELANKGPGIFVAQGAGEGVQP